jgi:hypothetical protein
MIFLNANPRRVLVRHDEIPSKKSEHVHFVLTKSTDGTFVLENLFLNDADAELLKDALKNPLHKGYFPSGVQYFGVGINDTDLYVGYPSHKEDCWEYMKSVY